MNTLAHRVQRHRRWIILFWVVMLAAGAFSAPRVVDRLQYDVSLPGEPGYETHELLFETYGNGGSIPPYLPVVTVPQGTTVAEQSDAVAKIFADLAAQFPHFRVVDHAMTGDPVFVTGDARTTFALVYTQSVVQPGVDPVGELEPYLAEQAKATGFDIALSGYDALGATENIAETNSSALNETLLAAIAAVVVLLFVFASFLALVPVVVAAVSILSTFFVLLGLTYLTDVSFVVQFLVALLGLGVAIDYSLLVVTRWREERARGRDNGDAIIEAVTHAGRAVLASGLTVGISLIALVVLPIPALRSAGIGGMLIPLISSAVVLTLLPALLGTRVGARVDWPKLRHEDRASRPWRAWAAGVVRFRWPATLVAVAVLGMLIIPLLGVKIGLAAPEAKAADGPGWAALQALQGGGVPAGVVLPVEVLVEDDADLDAVAAVAREVDGVAAAFAPTDPAWQRDGYAIVDVVPEAELLTIGDMDLIEELTAALGPQSGFVGVTGHGAEALDYYNAVFKVFPFVFLGIALLTFLLLVRTFRSVVLPLKAIALNIVSVAAALGATVAVWQWGWGTEAVFDLPASGAITFWVPVLVFAFLFGLSMDYEVFILARMREEYDASGSTSTAVIEGLGRTGRLVTSAALILFFAFVALSSIPDTNVKIFATALGIGIVLDATIVRALLVPALVSLFGSWNWWMPEWLARVLMIRETGSDEQMPDVPAPVGVADR